MARARLGDAAGTRALVEVLLLHRRLPAADVMAGMTAALRLRQPVAGRGRRRGPQRRRPARPGPVPLSLVLPPGDEPRRRRPSDLQQVTVLPTDPRPLPTVTAYDQLLTLDATATS